MKLLENSGETKVGVIQISKETLSKRQVRDICDSLREQNLTVLALRECRITDGDYKKLVKSVAVCESLLQLNLNVNVVNSEERVTLLARCLRKNKSLKSLYLHGSDLSGDWCETLCRALTRHPSLISLDLGDCSLHDTSIEFIIPLLSPRDRFQGLVELGLSGNDSVSGAAWCRLFQSLALHHHDSRLTSLYLDYCNLGNKAVTCLATALASMTTMRTLDLENTGITDEGAQFLLYLVEGKKENRPTTINLHGNDLDPQLIHAIESRLNVISHTPSTTESDTDSENESRGLRTIMLSKMLGDPAKVEALETLSKALTSYNLAMDKTNDDESGEETLAQETVDDVEATPGDVTMTAGDVTIEGGVPTSAPHSQKDAVSDHQDADDEAAETASQTSNKSVTTLSSLSDNENDDVIVNDIIQINEAGLSLAEPEEDLGDFLREIPCAPNYTVITPRTILSRASSYKF